MPPHVQVGRNWIPPPSKSNGVWPCLSWTFYWGDCLVGGGVGWFVKEHFSAIHLALWKSSTETFKRHKTYCKVPRWSKSKYNRIKFHLDLYVYIYIHTWLCRWSCTICSQYHPMIIHADTPAPLDCWSNTGVPTWSCFFASILAMASTAGLAYVMCWFSNHDGKESDHSPVVMGNIPERFRIFMIQLHCISDWLQEQLRFPHMSTEKLKKSGNPKYATYSAPINIKYHIHYQLFTSTITCDWYTSMHIIT